MPEDTSRSIDSDYPTGGKVEFVEEIGLILEDSGHPRIAGRLIGWLLICDPPHQSFDDLVEGLQVSKGSISNMTRLMIQHDLVERISFPGDRKTYFRLRKDAWGRMLERQLRITHRLSEAARHGLEALENEPDDRGHRLRQMHDFMQFSAGKIEQQIDEYEHEES